MPIDTLKRKHIVETCPKLPDDNWLIAVTDGHKFGNLTSRFFKKPFDPLFEEMMIHSAKSFLSDPCGGEILAAYIKSDEVSFLFPPFINFLGRYQDKINSTVSSHMTALFTEEMIKGGKKGGRGIFYTDILVIPTLSEVVDYLTERQLDGYINQLNSYARSILGTQEAVNESSLKMKGIVDLLKGYDTLFEQEKNWRKYGVLIHRKLQKKHLSSGGELVERRSVIVKRDLGLFKDKNPDLEKLLVESMTPKMRNSLRQKKLI